MTNLRIISDNAADRGALTASSTAGSLGVANLQSDVKSQPWRATSTAARIGITWTTSELIGGMFLPFCNLSPSATVRVRATNEAPATNLLKYSERFDNSIWQKLTGATLVPNTGLAPDGTLTADQITFPGLLRQNVSVTPGAAYTYSFWARLISGNASVGCDIGDGASVGRTITSALARYSFPLIAGANGWIDLSMGGASVIEIWGAQLEVGTVATSYYPSLDTFTSRASVGMFVGSTGALQTAAINVARMQYNPTNLSAPPTLLLEAAATNLIRDNTMVGASVGTPGFMPTTWARGTTAGWTANVQAIGVENGVAYIDFAVSGTASAANSMTAFYFETATGAPAVVGNTLTTSLYVKLVSGSLAGVSGMGIGYAEDDSGGVNIASTMATPVAPTSDLLRYFSTHTMAQATAAYFRPSFRFSSADTTTAVNFTLRIGLPQLEMGAFATSPIATSTVAVTRAADVSTSAPGARPAGYIDTWQSYDYDSGAVLACPAAAVKLRGFTAAQAASAYAYGGGACARHWLPAQMQALGVAIDIVDSANLQGYIEAARLVVGSYWSPANNADYGASMTIEDASKHYRTDGGDLLTDVGTRSRRMPLQLSAMTPADRTAMVNIMRGNGMAGPMLIGLFPGDSDLELERDHTIYGKLSSVSAMAIPYFSRYSAPLEIEEI